MRYLFVCICFVQSVFAQCAMCKSAVQNNQGNDRGFDALGTGIYWGILFLVLAVYIGLSLVFWKKIKVLFKELGKIYKS
jgi:hypothetical protein